MDLSPAAAVKLIQRSVAERMLTDVEDLTTFILDGPPKALPTHQGHMVDMYMRCSSLFRGARILIENDLPEESLILSRSLFTESLWLTELANVTMSEQIALIMGWRYASLGEVRGLVVEAHKAGLEDSPELVLGDVERHRKAVEGYGQRHGVLKAKKFPSVKDLAKSQGRREDLWSFELAHEMTHGSEAAHLLRHKGMGDAIAFVAATSDPDFICGAARLSARSMVFAHYAIASILDLILDRDLEDWLGEIEHCTALFEHRAELSDSEGTGA